MNTLLGRIVLSLVIAILTGLLLILLGGILADLKVPIAVTIGHFFVAWGWVLGILAGLWYFFSRGGITLP